MRTPRSMKQDRAVNSVRRHLISTGVGAWLLAVWPRAASAQTGSAARIKIGVIGSGRLGGTVGSLWVKAGHEVLFSSRHPEQLKDMVAELGPVAKAGRS